MSLPIGVKIFFGTGVLYGFSRLRVGKNSCTNLIQNIYHNIVFIVNLIAYFMIAADALCSIPTLLQDMKRNSIQNILHILESIVLMIVWAFVLSYLFLHSKIYIRKLDRSIIKLNKFAEKFHRDAKFNYFLYAYIFVLKLLFVILTVTQILKTKFNSIKEIKHTFIRIFGTSLSIDFLCLFSCVMNHLSVLLEDLMSDSSCSHESNLILTKSKSLRRKKYCFNDVTLRNIKDELLFFQSLSKDFLAYFGTPISLLFLNNIFFLITEVTTITTLYAFEMLDLVFISRNIIEIFLILYEADILLHKV